MSAPLHVTPNAPAAPKQKNHTLGIVALVTAVAGFVFACIPGALIVGWILLPIAFVLSIVALCMKGKKLFGILAMVLSVVGTIVGFIVFFTVVAGAVDEAFGGSEVSTVDSAIENEDIAIEEEAAEPVDEPAGPVEGSRENPFPLGTIVSNEEWEVSVNSVELGATEAVLAENVLNATPDEGDEYILVNVSAAYVGGGTGTPAVDLGFDYVTVDGVKVGTLETFAVAPDAFDSLTELYPGGTITGNQVFAVPSATAGEGTVAVRIGMFGDEVFFAAQ